MIDLSGFFLQYGPLGAIIIVLAWVVVMLWNENKEKDKKIDAWQQKYDALQEKRYDEAVSISDKVTGPLREQRDLSQSIYSLLKIYLEGKGK